MTMTNPTGIPSAAPAKLTEAELVFGVGYKTDAAGNPIEQGIGSPSNQSRHHLAALTKMQKLEDGIARGFTPEELAQLTAAIIKPAENEPAPSPEQVSASEQRISDLETKLAAAM